MRPSGTARTEGLSRRRRNRGIVTGAVALGVAGVALTASLITGGDRDTRPEPASLSPSDPATGTDPGAENGRITSVQRHLAAKASDYQWRAFDSASDKGLFVSYAPCDDCAEEVESLTVVGPAGPVTTLACTDALPCPRDEDWLSYPATLGPGADDVTVQSGDRTLQVIGYDGTVRRTLDLTGALDLPDDIRKLAWSPDGSRLAVATALDIWLVEGDGDPQLADSSMFGRIWGLGGWSPDGQSLLVDRYAGQNGADVVVLHLPSDGSPAMTPQTLYRSDRHFDWAGNVAWSPDGTRIAVRTSSNIVEISAEDGSVLARHPHRNGWLIWPRPTPTPTKSQSPQTWIDTRLTPRDGYGWDVPDPLKTARSAWLAVAADHLDPTGEHFEPQGEEGSVFTWQTDGSLYPVDGRTELVVDRDQPNPFDGCRYLLDGPAPSNGTESCSDERLAGPDGERATISRYQRLCGSWDPGREGDDARPGPGSTYATCGDFRVAVAVERRDGLIGYLVVDGRGTPDYNPFTPEAMAAVAADPRLTLPNAVSGVPSNQLAASFLSDHFPDWRAQPGASEPADQPGYASAAGRLGRTGLSMSVWPAGGSPVCGRSWLVNCVERRVYGADDPTTVFVGAWDEHDWADCCPRNSRAFSRQFVYVGPRHTVVVWMTRIVREHEDGIGAGLDQRVIDLLLDPRLQQARHR